jgi:hypothetical protein
MISFPSTVPPVPSFFSLLCLIPSPFIFFSLQSLIRSFVLCLFYPSCVFLVFFHTLFLLIIFFYIFTIYSPYGCPSLYRTSHPSLILPFVTTLTYFFVLCLFLVTFYVLSQYPFCLSFFPSILLLLAIFIILLFTLPVFVFFFSPSCNRYSQFAL